MDLKKNLLLIILLILIPTVQAEQTIWVNDCNTTGDWFGGVNFANMDGYMVSKMGATATHTVTDNPDTNYFRLSFDLNMTDNGGTFGTIKFFENSAGCATGCYELKINDVLNGGTMNLRHRDVIGWNWMANAHPINIGNNQWYNIQVERDFNGVMAIYIDGNQAWKDDNPDYNHSTGVEIEWQTGTMQIGINNIQMTQLTRINLDFNQTTSGTVVHTDGGYSFTNFDILGIKQADISIGRVTIDLNTNQRYQFDNNGETRIDENMTILSGNDGFATVKVITQTSSTIEDAIITTEKLNTDTNLFELIDRRLTNSEGETIFYASNVDNLRITVEADNYETITENIVGSEYVGTGLELIMVVGEEEDEPDTKCNTTTSHGNRYTTQAIGVSLQTTCWIDQEICHTRYFNGAILDDANCTTGTIVTYEIDVNATADGNFVVVITYENGETRNYQYIYKETTLTRVILTLTGTYTTDEQRENFFIYLILLIVLAATAETVFNRGKDVFFVGVVIGAIYLIPTIGVGIIVPAIAVATLYFFTLMKPVWSD